MKKFILTLTLLLVSFSGRAQVIGSASTQPVALGRTVFGLGAAIGLAGGMGVSFRHHFPSVMSYQIVAGIIKPDNRLSYDFGFELQADIMKGISNRFYACAATGYYFTGEGGVNELEAPYRVGIGAGNEWTNVNTSQFHIALEILLTYFSNDTVIPLPQLSAHYYFF
ncbi:MAG: hypothetical protein ACHQQQ_14235 [Bacteroidota bacterium]